MTPKFTATFRNDYTPESRPRQIVRKAME
jgi:hypothetical protein